LAALKNFSGSDQIVVASVLAAWIAYQSQSLISIDNIGLAVWGYLLGGALIGLSLSHIHEDNLGRKTNLQPLISSGFVFISLITSVIFFQAETSMHFIDGLPKPKSAVEIQQYKSLLMKPISYPFKEPSFILSASASLADLGDFKQSISLLKSLIKDDRKYYDAYELLAQIYEYRQNWQAALDIRYKIQTLDHFNYINDKNIAMDQSKNNS
jgi:tetratricopeptide (TPR) repeat protein